MKAYRVRRPRNDAGHLTQQYKRRSSTVWRVLGCQAQPFPPSPVLPALFHRNETATRANLNFVRSEPGVGGHISARSHAATTELRASTSAAASLSLISGSAAMTSSKSDFSSASFSSEGLSRSGALASKLSAGIAGVGRGLRTLTRKKKCLSGDQFKPDRMSSANRASMIRCRN